MINYKFINKYELYVYLPKSLKFNLNFHCLIAEIINFILIYNNINTLKKLTFCCVENIDYDKICKSYIFNVLEFFKSKKIPIYISKIFKENVIEVVNKKFGQSYASELNIEELILKKNAIYYSFKGDKEIHEPVNDIVKAIADRSLIINEEELRDFLTTVIGEIFSNSINHSEQDEVFLLFDVKKVECDFYLYVSIIDYGTTIISNVRKFFADKKISSDKCLKWAIAWGNTTRQGSGGYGLSMLIDYIKKVKGVLYIFSDNAYYSLETNGRECIEEKNNQIFCGTSVTFKIKLFDTDNIITYKDGVIDCFSLDDLK